MAAIETAALVYRYGRGVTALRGVDLAVPEGSVYALLGRNGAGKTTLLKILTGQLLPTAGAARVLGRDVRAITVADRQRIGYVAEGLRPPGWMTVHQLEAYLAPLYPSWDGKLASELRERFELGGGRRIRTLSRGEQMKVALLCALAPMPAVLLMDEPFTGMDVLTKDELVGGLLDSATRAGTTVLVASHDIAELEPLADRVGFLEEGKLLLSEPLESLYGRFFRVEATVASAAAGAFPGDWLRVERAGQQLRFILRRRTDADDPVGEVRRSFPAATDITARPASLREIFVALVGGSHQELEREALHEVA